MNKFVFSTICLSINCALAKVVDRLPSFPYEVDGALSYIKNKQLLPDNPVIIEAGAFDGTDTRKMSYLWPKGVIHSFEPVPENYHKLKRNTRLLGNVYCYPLALSDKNGVATFHVSEFIDRPGIPYASGSLLTPGLHLYFDNKVIFPKQISVSTIRLDDWADNYNIPCVDFFWLDIQGHELTALKHGINLLKKAKLVYVEVEFVEAFKGQPLYLEVKRWLMEQGFELIALDFDEVHDTLQSTILASGRYLGNALFMNTLRR